MLGKFINNMNTLNRPANCKKQLDLLIYHYVQIEAKLMIQSQTNG